LGMERQGRQPFIALAEAAGAVSMRSLSRAAACLGQPAQGLLGRLRVPSSQGPSAITARHAEYPSPRVVSRRRGSNRSWYPGITPQPATSRTIIPSPVVDRRPERSVWPLRDVGRRTHMASPRARRGSAHRTYPSPSLPITPAWKEWETATQTLEAAYRFR
jgi:hypothetical protein